MKKIIDLTLTVRQGMPGVDLETAKTIENDGWNAKTLHLYSHAGTHMDAPLHFGVNEKTIDKISLERCIGPAWLLDLSQIKPRAAITIADLGDLVNKIEQGDSLIVRSGWSRFVDKPEYRNDLPRISEELARWCVQRKIRILGVEPPSVADVNNPEELTLIHRILLEGNITIVEGLCNLEHMNQNKFEFFALPLKVENGDGAPARAFAIIEE